MPFGVYIHVPYCKTLCPYCDFVKVRDKGGVPERFVDALCAEIAASPGPAQADTLFFGGGTPSRFNPQQLLRVTDALRERFDWPENPEWSFEANPDDVSAEAVAAWREAGINRVSLGVQSFDDRVLKYLGRRHNAEGARRACQTIAAQFDNWSLDLMFGAPPIEAWQDTLQTAVKIAPPHIAAYGLTYEEGTPFARRADQALGDDEMLRMYQELEQAFSEFDHYEISNFGLPGRKAQHNLIYWRNQSYAGYGAGAYSYIGGVRARNHSNLDAYLAAPGAKEETLAISEREEKVETVIQHLRLREGLPRRDYLKRFGNPVEADFSQELHALEARGLIVCSDAHVLPTEEGFYLNNEIGLALVAVPGEIEAP